MKYALSRNAHLIFTPMSNRLIRHFGQPGIDISRKEGRAENPYPWNVSTRVLGNAHLIFTPMSNGAAVGVYADISN
jgi:hypothetical protein